MKKIDHSTPSNKQTAVVPAQYDWDEVVGTGEYHTHELYFESYNASKSLLGSGSALRFISIDVSRQTSTLRLRARQINWPGPVTHCPDQHNGSSFARSVSNRISHSLRVAVESTEGDHLRRRE